MSIISLNKSEQIKATKIGFGLRDAAEYICPSCNYEFNHPILEIVKCPKCAQAATYELSLYMNYPYRK